MSTPPELRKCVVWEFGEGINAYFHRFISGPEGGLAIIEREDGWVMEWPVSCIRFQEHIEGSGK